ncbi:MAG: pre-rRNA-processing protein esf1 [Marteilia pararefringens]
MPDESSEQIKDRRFKNVGNSSKYLNIPQEEVKVKIDSRFSSVFSDKDFERNVLRDPRTGIALVNTQENCSDYYYEDRNVEDDERFALGGSGSELDSYCQFENSEEEYEALDEEYLQKNLILEDNWNILDKDTEYVDIMTSRLSLCNTDWTNINANDIFVLVDSVIHKPERDDGSEEIENKTDESIESVKIYKSDIGKKFLDYEVEHGLCGIENLFDIKGLDFNGKEISQEDFNRIYELNRLKYFYAIIECSSPETAKKIYEELDGTEFLKSGIQIDLRFVPDEITMEEERLHDESNGADLDNYKPSKFVLDALISTKVNDNSWDRSGNNQRESILKRMGEAHTKIDEKEVAKVLEIPGSVENEYQEEIHCEYSNADSLTDNIDQESEQENISGDIEFDWEDEDKEKCSEQKKTESDLKLEKVEKANLFIIFPIVIISVDRYQYIDFFIHISM